MEAKKRCANFTSDEKIKLIQLIESEKNVLLNKKTDGVTNKAKEEVWHRISGNFNATSCIKRPADSFKKMWNTLKSTAKTYKSKQRISVIKTGGGPEDIKCDPILEEVLRFMGRGGVGLSCVNDSDITIIDPIIDVADHEMDFQEQQVANYQVPMQESSTWEVEDQRREHVTTSLVHEVSAATDVVRPVMSSYKSRRRPRLPEKGQSVYEMTKIKAIENDEARAAELHLLRKRKLEQDTEMKDVVLQKMKNNENVDPMWMAIFK